MLHHLEKESVQAVDCIAPLTSEKFKNAVSSAEKGLLKDWSPSLGIGSKKCA